MMQDAVELLKDLGFGNYEARAYVALLQHTPLNGYELAKLSGVPRANIYDVLQKLVERGAVVRLGTPQTVRYRPLPPGELLQRLDSHFQEIQDQARRALEQLTAPVEHEYVCNVQGYSGTLEHTRSLIQAAQQRLMIANWPQEASALAPDLARALARGVEVITLCFAACPGRCSACQGKVYRYQVVQEEQTRQFLLVADDAEVLASEIGPGEQAFTIRTRQKLLVDLAEGYVRRSTALAAVFEDLADCQQSPLKPQTLAILAALNPFSRSFSWLQPVNQDMNHQESQPLD